MSKRVSRVSSFRKGWTETIDDSGSKSYVHNATGEKVRADLYTVTITSKGRRESKRGREGWREGRERERERKRRREG